MFGASIEHRAWSRGVKRPGEGVTRRRGNIQRAGSSGQLAVELSFQ